MNRKRVLWIDMHAETYFLEIIASIRCGREFDLHVAHDVHSALEEMRQYSFDAVISGVRMHAGHDQKWAKLNAEICSGTHELSSEFTNKLGLLLLYSVLAPGTYVLPSAQFAASWCRPQKFGVITMMHRDEYHPHLDRLGITMRRSKAELFSNRGTITEMFRKLAAA